MKLFFIIIFSLISISQDAESYANRAMMELSNDNLDRAVELLDSAYDVSKDNKYKFEKAIVYYRIKKFKEAISITEEFIAEDGSKVQYYQLLSSCYDFIAFKEKARDVVLEGIEKFPDSGRLYYELGVIEIGSGNRDEAAEAWEKGIFLEPTYGNNYFQLTKFFSDTKYRVYSLIYGEIFLNMQSSDDKKQEISMLLYDIYQDILSHPHSDEYPFTDFIGEYDVNKAVRFPFLSLYQQNANSIDFKKSGEIGFKEIVSFRKQFFQKWLDMGYNDIYPNVLNEYFQELFNNNIFETYSYLMLSSGDPEFFSKYSQENMSDFQKLISWLSRNPMEITKDNLFYSKVYRDN